MQKNITYYRTIQNALGAKTKADWQRNNTTRELERDFERPLDVETFEVWELGALTGKEIRLEVTKQKYSAANGYIITVTSLLDSPVVIGDVVYRTDTGEYYICTVSYKESRMFYKCELTRCNYTMRWQDNNANVFEYPVFDINSTQYNSGESGDKTIIFGSSQHLITVTADKNTIALDHGKRLFWDRNKTAPTVFRITQNDTTASYYDKGLLKITIAEDQYDPDTDSIEEWLCNYFRTQTVTILYSGQPVIRVGGTKTLRVDTDKTVEWAVEGEIPAEITPEGNSAKIKCPPEREYIDKKIAVRATVGNNSGICELTVTGGI